MLRFENLTKQFGQHTVFAGLSHTFNAGCFALPGPNGSGKSTLMSVLAGVLAPDAGEIWIDTHSLRTAALAAKARLAYVPDECDAYPFMTGRAFLELVASTKHLALDADTLQLAERLRLGSHLDKRFEQMSLGTRKKIMLTATALGAPAVIIADEPSNGLDTHARNVLIEWFAQLGRSSTVLFTTHDPEFAAACGAALISFSTLHPQTAASAQ